MPAGGTAAGPLMLHRGQYIVKPPTNWANSGVTAICATGNATSHAGYRKLLSWTAAQKPGAEHERKSRKTSICLQELRQAIYVGVRRPIRGRVSVVRP